MIRFINAKINIGLQIVERRKDGFHNLETVFYPIGIKSGTPSDPAPFCDILEVTEGISSEDIPGCMSAVEECEGVTLRYLFTGIPIDCRWDDNLVCRAVRAVINKSSRRDKRSFTVSLDKHILFGAGVGGGSADAMFAAETFNEVGKFGLGERELYDISMELGSDTTFFLINRPAFMEGKGENLTPVELPQLSNCWLVLCNPPVHVSTKEAFSRVIPAKGEFDLRKLPDLPIGEWRHKIMNDFERSVFPLYPEIRKLKEELYIQGAVYASMSGSGSAVYGIFRSRREAEQCYLHFKENATLSGVSLLSL